MIGDRTYSSLKGTLYFVCLAVVRIVRKIVPCKEVSILTYHSIGDDPAETAVSANQFLSHLNHLKARGHTFVSLSDVLDWMSGKKILTKAIALTFDDGYADFEISALPILEKFKAPATVFIVGDSKRARSNLKNDIPLLSEAALERIGKSELIEIGYHTLTHPNLLEISPELFEIECRSQGASFFAYPGGKYSSEMGDRLSGFGYGAAFSIKPGLVYKDSYIYAIPRNVVTKFMKNWEVELRATMAISLLRKIRGLFI